MIDSTILSNWDVLIIFLLKFKSSEVRSSQDYREVCLLNFTNLRFRRAFLDEIFSEHVSRWNSDWVDFLLNPTMSIPQKKCNWQASSSEMLNMSLKSVYEKTLHVYTMWVESAMTMRNSSSMTSQRELAECLCWKDRWAADPEFVPFEMSSPTWNILVNSASNRT